MQIFFKKLYIKLNIIIVFIILYYEYIIDKIYSYNNYIILWSFNNYVDRWFCIRWKLKQQIPPAIDASDVKYSVRFVFPQKLGPFLDFFTLYMYIIGWCMVRKSFFTAEKWTQIWVSRVPKKISKNELLRTPYS